jgi:two-component system, NtrC family, response regulator HydG
MPSSSSRDDAGTPVGYFRPLEVATFRISVVEGLDVGRELEIDGTQPSRAHIGKSELSALRLSDPKVSRDHLTLDVMGGMLRVVDRGSTNGTYVNGTWVREARLVGGETIRLGDTSLRVDAIGNSILPSSNLDSFGSVLGRSMEMRRLYPLLDLLAKSEVPIVIGGETGTGKEAVAEAIHEASSRSGRELIVFDCTAIPPNLMESALFGHERGAFTGAVTAQAGLFEQAHGSTLLLDEIADLEPQLQPKLLRAVERSEVKRVGGTRWIKVDVRVIAATRRDLEREIQAGRFRDDLFYRLAVTRVELPALRDRRGDVAFLARHFWRSLSSGTPMDEDFLRSLEAYDWPGNIRELRNVVARRLALGTLAAPPGTPSSMGRMSSVPPPPDSLSESPVSAGEDPVERVLELGLPLSASRDLIVQEFERRYLGRLLGAHGGNATHAAQAAGVARRYFQLLRGKRGL